MNITKKLLVAGLLVGGIVSATAPIRPDLIPLINRQIEGAVAIQDTIDQIFPESAKREMSPAMRAIVEKGIGKTKKEMLRLQKNLIQQTAKESAITDPALAKFGEDVYKGFVTEVYQPFKDSKNTRLPSPLREMGQQ